MKIFNQLGASLLIALLFVKVLVVPAIYLDFEIRKEYIKKYLCENRNRPELHCDGKCYLAKQLATADEKQQTEKGQELNQLLFGVEFLHTLPNFNFLGITTHTKSKSNYTYVDFSLQKSIFSVFHPPCLVNF